MGPAGPDGQGRRRTGRERLTRLAVGAAIVLSAISLASQTAPNSATKVLLAESFVLMDASGRRRAALALRADGTPALGILDEAGKVRAALAMREDGTPSLGLVDKDGKTRAELALRPDGTPTLGLADTDGRTHVELSLRSDGSPSLAFADKRGKTRVVLLVRANGALTLALADPGGKTRVELAVRPDGSAYLAFAQKDETPRSGLGSPFLMNRGGSCGARRSGPCSSPRRRAAGNELDRDGWRGDPFDLEPGRQGERAGLHVQSHGALSRTAEVEPGHECRHAKGVQDPGAAAELDLDGLRRQLGDFQIGRDVAELDADGDRANGAPGQ